MPAIPNSIRDSCWASTGSAATAGRYGSTFSTRRTIPRRSRHSSPTALARSQLIVGPVYEDELAPVLRIAEQEGIPVVSPLATIDHTHSDVLFQMAPDPARKYAKLARPLNSGRRVVLIYSQHTDTTFEQAVKALIPDVG